MALNFPIELIGNRASGGVTFATLLYDSGDNLLVSIETDIPDNWNDNNTPYDVFRLEIGTSCTSIGANAFSNSTNLSGDLVIPDSVTTIATRAFYNNNSLDGDLVIGNGVTTIGSYAFMDTNSASITIGESVSTIDRNAFYRNSNDWDNVNFVRCLNPEPATLGLYVFWYPALSKEIPLYVPNGAAASYNSTGYPWTLFTIIEDPA